MITAFHVDMNKSTKADLVWEVLQERSYPYIFRLPGRMMWAGCDDIMPSYGNKATGLLEHYYCTLRNKEIVKYRGRVINQIEVTFVEYPDLFPYVRENSVSPPPSVLEFYLANVLPKLKQFVLDNVKELRREAILGIRKTVEEKLKDARSQVEKLEDEMEAALVKLEASKC